MSVFEKFWYSYCGRIVPALRGEQKCSNLNDLLSEFDAGDDHPATQTLLSVARARGACELPSAIVRCRVDLEHVCKSGGSGCETMADKALVFPSDRSARATDSLLWFVLEFRDDRRGKFGYALLGFLHSSEMVITSRGRILLDDIYAPCMPYYALDDVRRQRFCVSLSLDLPVASLFPRAITQVERDAFDAVQLRNGAKLLFSFCVRWHCTKHATESQRRQARNDTLDAHLRAPSLRFCRGRPTEIALFGEIASFGALVVLTATTTSDPLAHFVRTQWLQALRATARRWLRESVPKIASNAVVAAIESLIQVRAGLLGFAHTDDSVVWCDADAVCVRLLVDGRTAELGAFLWPSSATLASGCTLRDGVVAVRGAEQQASLLCDVAERFLADLRSRVPEPTAVAMREALAALDFDTVELFDRGFEKARPCYGHFYAADRTTAYDDVAARTFECIGLRFSTYSAPRVNGLERSDEQLRRLRDSEAAAQYSIQCADGVRRAVPVYALHTLMHRRDHEAAVGGDSDELARSAERMRQPLNRSSSVPSDVYALDGDAAIASDTGFRRWMRERCTRSNEAPSPVQRRGRARVEIRYEDSDDDDDDRSSSDVTASPPSPETMRQNAIEDIYENVYENGGVPLCVLRYARDNANGEKPRDASRMNYFPFLRSLQLPGVTPREIAVHLMKNVQPSQFSEYYNRLTKTHPEQFRRSRQRSHAALLARGRDPATAAREASCFPRCSTKQMRKTCPFAVDGGADAARVTALRRELRAAGVELGRAETIVRAACSERPGEACRQFFIATRPAPLHAAAVPPFPGEQRVYINSAREYTYLAAAHMHASLRTPPGYVDSDFVDIEELARTNLGD